MKDDLVNFMYGLAIILTPLFIVASCVLYMGNMCDTLTFLEGVIVGLGYFKFAMKLYDYETKNL